MSATLNRDKPNNSKESSVAEYAVVAPDGGWGWVVVLSALYCNAVVDGILFTFGIFMADMVKTYNTNEVNIALIGSLMYGVHLTAGPLCAALAKAFGIRPLVTFGSVLVSISLASAALEPPLWLLTILFGVCAGIGLCFVYMLSISVAAMYFTRFRILAVGIVVCGTGLGTMILAQASGQMLKRMNWKQSHLVLSGCALLMALAGLSFKPLEPLRINVTNQLAEEDMKSTVSLTSLFDEEVEEQAVMIITKSRSNSISSAFDATSAALGVFTGDLVEEKEFLKDNLARTCARWFSCFRPQTRVLLMHPKMKKEIMSIDRDSKKWRRKHLKSDVYGGRWNRILSSFTSMKWSLLRDVHFLLFCISSTCSSTAIIILFTFESARFISVGHTEDDATFMITILGASNMFWRLFLGAICLLPKVNYHALQVTGHCLAGAVTIASASTSNMPFYYIYCVIVGLGLGCFAVFRPIILLELVGKENLSDATGIALFFNGLFSVFGPPICGWIRTKTGDFYLTYVMVGILFLISGVLLIFITGSQPNIRQPQDDNGATSSHV